MATQQFIMGVIRFLHDLFTVVWIGGLTFMVLTMIPSVKKTFGKNPQAQQLINSITKKHRIFVYISIVGLFITGLLLGKSNKDYLGFMSFNNLYSVLASVKHILTFTMVLIALIRSIIFGRADVKLNTKQNQISMLLIISNLVLGLSILFISALLSAI